MVCRRLFAIVFLLVFVAAFLMACGGGKKTKHQATEGELACSNEYELSGFQPCMEYEHFEHFACNDSIETWRVDCVEDCVEALYAKLGKKAGCNGADTCVETCLSNDAPDCRSMYTNGEYAECAMTSDFNYYDYSIWVCFPGLPGDTRECTRSCFEQETTDCRSLRKCADSCD
jgi:hypothetical protein